MERPKIVATKVVGSPSGTPQFYRIAEIDLPSLEALNACAASEEAQATIAHAESISTGGKPIFLLWPKRRFCPSAQRTKSQPNIASRLRFRA